MSIPDDEQYRVIVRGTAPGSRAVASSPRDRASALAGQAIAEEIFADDISAGDAKIEVVSEGEGEYRRRLIGDAT